MDNDTIIWPDPDDLDFDDEPPPPPIALALVQRAELIAALEVALDADGCDNTLRAAQRWARGARVPWPPLRRQLECNGGYCDCEILFNVFPGEEADW